MSPSGEYAESRPFKIFISLLDKWEIGAILTETIIYDSLKSIMNLVQHPSNSGEDVRRVYSFFYIPETNLLTERQLSMTASTLYEAAEPQILWKHLLERVFEEIMSDGDETEVGMFACVANPN